MTSRPLSSTGPLRLAAIAAVLLAVAAAALPPRAEAQRRGRAAAPRREAPAAPRSGGARNPALDAALYVVEPFFDTAARIPRPYADAKARLEALAASGPEDASVALALARVSERLGAFDEAAAAMERYAALSGRSPNALRRLAAFYRGRARAADEVRALDELASKLPPRERAPLYRRAIAAINDARPAGLAPDPFYEKLVDLDLEQGTALREYVSLLLESDDAQRALATLDRVGSRPGEKSRAVARALLAERARVYDRTGARERALEVYERAFDPLWPRGVASDYYTLLSRYGLYRERRRELQALAAADPSMTVVARLFNVYAYEGNLPAAGRLLASVERARKSDWTPEDLELAASLYAQIGDLDEASRYLYSLYLRGAFAPGSADRERVLARLFTALATADSGATRLAPGGISLYRDIARVDARPGALNAILSLVLAGNNPAAEYALEEARAGGYLNRALAYTIYERFASEYPASPRLGAMTADLVRALADLGADREVVAAGAAFLARAPESADYERVALEVADAHVRLGDRAAERAVVRTLLDRVAARRPANRPLVERSPSRWIYRPDPQSEGAGDEPYDDAPELFVAPNGAPVEASRAGGFASDAGEEGSSTYEPTSDSRDDDSGEPDAPEDYLGRPDPGPSRPSYGALLERMVASFEADERRPEALAFFWGEVRKHPADEGLLERFLSWLGSTSLVNEQVRAYRLALERYDKPTWLHRFARWHVRRGRGAEVRRLTEEVARTLDDEGLASYLREFAGYGGSASGDELNWDNAIALEVTRLALTRFPNNPAIARMLLERLATAGRWDEWERVAREHYFADREIRRELLERLSRTGALAARLAEAREGAGGGLEAGPSTAFAYAVFAADAARWLSRHDEAVAAYRRLVELYPGEPAYAEPLADLLRSFAARDPRLYGEAAAVLDRLAAVHPTERRYATAAGEVLASAGDMREAAKRWRSLVATAPGSPAVRLEVATVFWDYYQFDDAAAELVALREAARDPSLYAFRLGAIYDSRRDLDRAVPEYVRALAETDADRDRARDRLAELSRREGVLDRAARAYAAERAARPGDWRLVAGYADFLRWIDRTGDALELLERETASTRDVALLEEARDRFRAWRDREGEARALERLAEAARDERERIRARLQLAGLYDELGRPDDAAAVFERLVAENPTNVGVLDEAINYLWSSGRVDRSAALSREVISRSRGEYRKRYSLALARRQASVGRLDDAEATLRAYYAEDPLDAEAFSELARVLGEAGKGDALAALYRETLERVRSGELPAAERDARVAELRRGTIATLERLGRHQEAVDQHIEIVNREPESEDALDAAFDYAARHGLADRLAAYYEKLAAESFKDYRWSLVLARVRERRGDAAGAADAYRRAVANEPQRVDLRLSYASALERAGRDEDAVAELRRGWEIDGRDPSWLLQAARVRARQGREADAGALVDEALAARPAATAAELLGYAEQLAGWSLLEKSAQVYERAFEAARARPQDSYLGPGAVARYVEVAARVRPPAAVFGRLEALRRAFLAEAARPDSFVASSARGHAEAVAQAEREALGRAALEFGSGEELGALEAALVAAASARTSAAELAVEERQHHLAIARAAGLLGAEQAIQTSVVETFLAETSDGHVERFRAALGELVEVYARRAMYAEAASRLAAYRERDPRPGDYDYDRRIAELYRLAGDAAGEQAALERLYAGASGAILDDGGEQAHAVRRLFELLVATGQRDRVVALAARPSPYQLVLVNFLVEKGDRDLALRAIQSAAVSPAWVAAKSAELGLYFRDASPSVEAAFREALRARPIGELVGAPFDAKRWLAGTDYYLTARNYGIWLDLVANRGDAARDWIVGRAEDRPRDAAAQAQLARYYLAREAAERALAHADLAVELDARHLDAVAARGEALHALGRTEEAIAAWSQLVERPDAGSEEFRVYFAEMSGHGQLERALAALRPKISSLAARGRFGAVSDLVAEMGEFGRTTPEAWPAVVDALYGAAVDAPDDLQIALAVLRGDLAPLDRRTPFYRLLTDRLAALAASLASDPDGYRYVIVGGEYLEPADELSDWRRRAADHLIETGALDEARALLDAIDAGRGAAAGDSGQDYSWVQLARVTVELRAGRRAEALAAAERYCAPASAEAGLPDAEKCQAAAEVLRANGAAAEADAMLEAVYRRRLDAGDGSDAVSTGLAEVLYRRGRAEEADAVLSRLAARRSDSAASLAAAADVAARAGRFALAVSLREAVSRVSRADASNALELARLRAAAGDAARGAADLAAVAGDERAPNSVRAQAVALAAELAAGDGAARAAAAARAASGGTEPERVLAALVAGDGAALARVAAASRSPLPALALARAEYAAGRREAAEAAFERALAADPAGVLAGATAFAGPTPVDALVAIYAATGRPDAALALATANADDYPLGESSPGYSFDPRPSGPAPALASLAQRNDAGRARSRADGYGALAEAAARAGRWEVAVSYARSRVALLGGAAPERAAAEARAGELETAEREAALRSAATLRVRTALSAESVAIRDFMLD